MKDRDKTKEQLINELESLRRRVCDLEELEARLKETESLLKEGEELHQLIISNMSDAVFITNDIGDFVYVFPNTRVIFGYSQKEVEAMGNATKLFGDEPFDPSQLASVGEIQNLEWEITDKEGKKHFLLITLKRVSIKGGTVLYTCRDITERKRAEEDVRRSEAKFLDLYENAPCAYLSVGTDSIIGTCNRCAGELLGYSREELIGKSLLDLYADTPAGKENAGKVFKRFLAGELIADEELQMQRADGSPVWISLTVNAVRDSKGHIVQSRSMVLDISERKKAQEALHRLNRELRAVSNCNQILLRAVDEQALLNEICRVICDEAGYRLAWVGYAENDDAKTIRPVAWAGFESGYIADAKLSWSDDTERGRGPAGIAVRSGEIVYVQDFTTDPRMIPWRESALQRGYRSGIALPLKDESANVFGVLLIYHPEAYAMTSDEIELMESLAGDLAFGINTIRTRNERRRSEEALRANEEKFRTVADWTYDWEYWVDPLGRLKYVSPSCKRVTGFVPEEFAEDPGLLSRIVHPTDKETYEQHEHLIRERGADIEEVTLEFRIIALDGTVHWIEHVCRPVYGGDGAYLGRRVSNRDVTEREKARQALRESEEQYRAVFDNAGMGIDLLDREGGIVRVNKALSNILGYTEEELRRLTFLDITHPEDREISKRNLKTLMAGEIDSYRLEKRYVKKDGSIVWADLWSTAIRDEKGEHAGTVVVIDDITERKNVEQNLAEQVMLMESLLEAIPAPVFFKNTDHVYIGCNSAFAEIMGRPKEHIIGKSVFEVAPSELAQVYRTQDDALFHSPGSQVYETSVRSSDGSRHDVMFHKATFLDSVGEVAGLIGVILDITDRKKVEEALRESEAFYRSLYENISDCIFIIDVTPEGRFRFVSLNPAEERAVGMTTEQVANKFPEDLVSEDVAAYVNSRYRMCVEKRETIHYEEVLDLPKGKMSFLTSLVPLEGPDGRIYRIIGVARDISEQKNLQGQLLQAQKMEAIGTLAGGIAHDFNNLLQVALGYSELLLQGKSEQDPDYADLRKIHQSARSGSELVRNLLAFSRKVEPKPVPMDLNHEVTHIEKLLHRTIPKMIEIRLDLAGGLERINADPAQMEQIIMNLALNARDAMGEEGSLTIRTENVTLDEEYCRLNVEAKPGDYVLLSVSDTGHGMDRETMQHIFEPFYTTKELGRGTGLGLAMVYGIVKQHDGHIDCYSEVGKGTTFKLYFPAIPSTEEPAVDETGVMPAFGTETVLLVDDEDFVRDLGERILTRHGYTVLAAANGEEALEVYNREKDRIALIILDLFMPTTGGKDCLKRILDIDPQAKVLIASGYLADASTRECIELGAKGFVAKPFRFKDLLREVRKALDKT